MTSKRFSAALTRLSATVATTVMIWAAGLIFAGCLAGCETVDEGRIPSLRVSINIRPISTWNTYGVSGFGDYQYFVLSPGSERLPAGFAYNTVSATGYGGVLLIMGMDPFTGDTMSPQAYDLSCPVEKSPTVRVAIEPATSEAVCPVCLSHYDVTMRGGAPISGPAADKSKRYGLRRYSCIGTPYEGYVITNPRLR